MNILINELFKKIMHNSNVETRFEAAPIFQGIFHCIDWICQKNISVNDEHSFQKQSFADLLQNRCS